MEAEVKDIDLEELDELEDIELDKNQIFYEVWLVSDDANNCATDFDFLIDDGYTELVEAEKCFSYFKNSDNLRERLANVTIPDNVAHLYLRLEACIDHGDDGTECVDLINDIEVTI